MICSKCRPKEDKCPICRVPYDGRFMRNRTAEDNAKKLDQMIQEREEIFSEDKTSQGLDVLDVSAESENRGQGRMRERESYTRGRGGVWNRLGERPDVRQRMVDREQEHPRGVTYTYPSPPPLPGRR